MCCVAVVIMDGITVISISAIDSALCSVHTILCAVVAISLLIQRLTKASPVERSILLSDPSVQRSTLPSHTARTVLMITLIAIQVLMLLKDILSSVPRVSSYVASLLTAMGTVAGLVYSDVVGFRRPLSSAILLLIYWFICSTFWLLRLTICFLLRPVHAMDMDDVCVLLDTLMLLLYLGILVLECTWIVSYVSVFSVLCGCACNITWLFNLFQFCFVFVWKS